MVEEAIFVNGMFVLTRVAGKSGCGWLVRMNRAILSFLSHRTAPKDESVILLTCRDVHRFNVRMGVAIPEK